MTKPKNKHNFPLRQSEQGTGRYHSLIQNLLDLICVVDEGKTLRFVSPKGEKLLGREADHLEGVALTSLTHPEDDLSQILDFAMLHPNEIQTINLRLRRIDGTYVRVAGVVQNLLGDSAINGVIISGADVNWRNQVECQGQVSDKSVLIVEEKLRKLSQAVEAAPVSILITDTNGHIEYINPFFSAITGYDLDEISGRNPAILQSGQTPPETYHQLWKALLSGNTWEGEFINKKKNGDLYVELAKIAPIFDANEKITHFVAIKQDITERKQIAQRLLESEERFRMLFEDSADAYLILDRNTFVDCNQATVEMLRANSKEDLLSTHPSELSPAYQPDGRSSAEKADEMIRIALKKGSHRFEWIHQRMDGEEFPVEVLLTPISIDEKVIIHTVWRDITERKRLDGQLRASEARYRNIIEHAGDIVYRISDMGFFEYANPQAMLLTGYDEDELIGKIFIELVHPNWQQRVQEFYLHQRNQRIPETSYLFPILTKTGEQKWVEQIVNLIEKPGGLIELQGIARNVTERIRIEKELSESKLRYEELTTHIPVGVFRIRRFLSGKFKFEYFSSRAGVILGVDHQKVLNSPDVSLLNRLIHPDDIDSYKQAFQDAVLNKPYDIAWTGRGLIEGDVRWIEISAKHTEQENGESIWDGIIADITERKHITEELLSSDARFRALFEQKNDAVFIIDMEGHYLTANQRAMDIMGYTLSELATLSIAETSAEHDQTQNILARLQAGESIPIYERLARKKSGDIFPVEINVEMVRDSNGKPLHIQSILRDITERKYLERELRRREREFSSLVENTTDLIARLGTDLRYTYCNPEFERQGYRSNTYLGKTILEVGTRAKDSTLELDRAAHKALETGKIQQVEHILLTKSGFRHYQTQIIPEHDDEGHIVSLLTVGRDVTSHKHLVDALKSARDFAEKLASTDELTGIYNRRGFLEMARREVGRLLRFNRPFSILFVDVDYFKKFNDEYSYEVGDQVLKIIAETLQKNSRDFDVIGRYGGEEMVILLPEISLDGAAEAAERLRKRVENIRVPSVPTMTISLGVAAFTPSQAQATTMNNGKQEEILGDLIAKAAQALHIAKRQGRNQVAIYDKKLEYD